MDNLQNKIKTLNITPQQIVFITWDNFRALKPEWLADEDFLLKIKAFAFEIILSSDIFEAMECFDILQNLLNQISKQNILRPDIFMEYLRILSILKAGFLLNLNNQDMESFFQENLIFCLEVQDFDLKEQIYKVLNLFRKDKSEFEFYRHIIISGIETNHEFLGTTFLQKDNKKWPDEPKVSNWIQNYKEFCVSIDSGISSGKFVKKTGNLGGGFERISYIEKSKEARTLSRDEQNILMRLLDFYDWIKNIKPGEKYSPYENEEISSYMIAQNGRLDEVEEPKAKEDEASNIEQKFEPRPVPPIIPVPIEKPIVPVAPIQEIKEEKMSSTLTSPSPSLSRRGTDGQEERKEGLIQPIEIEIEVPPGISFGPPQKLETKLEEKPANLLNVKSQIKEKKKQIEGEIDKKIEELKKKTK